MALQGQNGSTVVGLFWSSVPNAASYIISRTEPNPSSVSSADYTLPAPNFTPSPPYDQAAMDVKVYPNVPYTYWVTAMYSDNTISNPSPVANVTVVPALNQPSPQNLTTTVYGTQTLPNGTPGSRVTWEWDAGFRQYGYGIAIDVVTQGISAKMYRDYMPLPNADYSGQPPRLTRTVNVESGSEVRFCVSVWPVDHPNQANWYIAPVPSSPMYSAGLACSSAKIP